MVPFPMTRRTRRKQTGKQTADEQLTAEITELRARAQQLGLRLAGEKLEARLPQARCTEPEKARAQQMADEAGISLTEHIRRRACYP